MIKHPDVGRQVDPIFFRWYDQLQLAVVVTVNATFYSWWIYSFVVVAAFYQEETRYREVDMAEDKIEMR